LRSIQPNASQRSCGCRRCGARDGIMGSQTFFEAAFGVGAGAYVLAFAGCVYGSASAQARLGVSLLACALPALLATELSGGDVVAGDALAGNWLQEFVGMAVMVACTCSAGALVGHLGKAYEYAAHFALMMVADYSCDGPHVNPLVTTTQCVAKPEQTWTDGLTRIAAQLGGGVVGWRLLLAAGAYMPGDVGGPAPDARLPLYYVFLSECLGGAALCGAVWAFATTKMGDVYVRKMALINCTLRTVILAFGATGPAVNPALAFSYVFATEGAWPTLENHWPSYVAYWFGGLTGAVAMGLCPCGTRPLVSPDCQIRQNFAEMFRSAALRASRKGKAPRR